MSNERENKRKEKKRKKEHNIKIAVWVIACLLILAIGVMKACEINVSSIKDRFVDSNGKFTLGMTTDEDAYPYLLDGSKNVNISTVNDKLCVLTENSLTVLNPSNAEKQYSFDHGYANPMISCADKYICTIDQGGTRIHLDNKSGNVYEKTTARPILNADVSNQGDVVYALKKDNLKSGLYVISNSLKFRLKHYVKDGYIVDVAIDKGGNRIAYAVISSENAVLTTTVYTYSINDKKVISSFKYDDSNILDLKYQGSDLYIVADNCVSVVSSGKNKKDVFKAGTIFTNAYTYTSNGELLVDYAEYDGASESTVAYIKANGKVKTSINLDKRVKCISATNKDVYVLFDDKVDSYSITSGKLKKSSGCDDSIKSVHPISSKTFIQKGQTLDVLD